jgi:hypothetical protein
MSIDHTGRLRLRATLMHGDGARHRFDTEAIRAGHPVPGWLLARGFDLRRSASRWVMVCPFHDERNPSFTVWPDRFHCFGCGAHGDVISLVSRLDGLSFLEACQYLSGSVAVNGFPTPTPPREMHPKADEPPSIKWPRDLRRGTVNEFKQLARTRDLDVAACQRADELGTLLFGTHRQQAAWILTDPGEVIAEARRLDGQRWFGTRKADTLVGARKGWLLGSFNRHPAPEGIRRVAVVEGGPDYLAALHWAGLLGCADLLPVAVLGREVARVDPRSLRIFEGRRIRIFPHADPDPATGRAFSDRWGRLAISAGATAVTTFELRGLRMLDGRPVTDLNDAVLCPDPRQLGGMLDF